MSEKLSPERAVRLLRAKAHELEAQVLQDDANGVGGMSRITALSADIALIASLLADHIERSPGPSGPELTDPDDIESLQQDFREGFDEGRP